MMQRSHLVRSGLCDDRLAAKLVSSLRLPARARILLDHGTVSVGMIAAMAVLTALVAGIGSVAAAAQMRWRVQATADLAAIAVSMSGDCGDAQITAMHNHATVQGCQAPSADSPAARVVLFAEYRLTPVLAGTSMTVRIPARARASL